MIQFRISFCSKNSYRSKLTFNDSRMRDETITLWWRFLTCRSIEDFEMQTFQHFGSVHSKSNWPVCFTFMCNRRLCLDESVSLHKWQWYAITLPFLCALVVIRSVLTWEDFSRSTSSAMVISSVSEIAHSVRLVEDAALAWRSSSSEFVVQSIISRSKTIENGRSSSEEA